MGEVIVVTSGKGGVGKTTTTANVGTGLAKLGKKVVLIDTDIGLRNLDVVMGLENHIIYNIVDVIEGNCRLHQAIIKDRKHSNLYLLPSAQSKDKDAINPNQMVNLVEKLKTQYDYILIDAPPTLGGWVMNILCASDRVIIPVEASPWGMFGLANMFDFLNDVKQITPELSVMGVVLTKVDTRKNYFKQTMETFKEMPDIHLFDTFIRVDSSIEWSQDSSAPVVEFKKSSRSAGEYMELAREVMEYGSR